MDHWGTDSNLDGVLLKCNRHAPTWVRLWDCQTEVMEPYPAHLRISAQFKAPGVGVSLHEIFLLEDDLVAFFDQLAGSFAGWQDERSWNAVNDDLSVSARFHSGGHVELTWTLRQTGTLASTWQATLTTWTDAGEDMRRLAADARLLIDTGREL